MRPTPFDLVETPEALETCVLAVKSGKWQSLVLVGRGGTGKSRVVREHFPDDNSPSGAAWKSGRISAVQFYMHLYCNPNRTIVLDDAPNIAKDLNLAGLLRQLCEKEDVRTVSWDTQGKGFGGEDGIPTCFRTSSRLILITNKWMDRHPEVEALETRCHLVRYEPSVRLLHEKALGLPNVKPAVWKYVDAAVRDGRVHHISIRDYLVASEKLVVGMPWKPFLEQQFLPDNIEELDSDEAVILGWARRRGYPFGSRDLLMGPKRFRGRKDIVEGLLNDMVARGVLEETKPEKREGQRGRPPASRYAVAKGSGSRKSLSLVG